MARGRKRQLVWSPPADGVHSVQIVPERSTHLGSFPFNKVETPESVKEAPIYQLLLKLCASVLLGRVRGAIAHERPAMRAGHRKLYRQASSRRRPRARARCWTASWW